MSRKQKKTKFKYDPVIMAELLNQPGVKEKVDELEPHERKAFKEWLVRTGAYNKLVVARQKRILRGLVSNLNMHKVH